MVTVDQINRVKRALSSGQFESGVAKSTGLSRTIVRRIAAGEFDSMLGPVATHCPDCGGVNLPCVLCAVRKSQNSDVCNIALVSLEDIAAIGLAVGKVRKASVDNEVAINLQSQRWGLPQPGDETQTADRRQVRDRLNRNYSGKSRQSPNEAQRRYHPFRNMPPLQSVD